jgi:hypothetical protein
MPVHLLVVPYDSGHRELRMGRGPLHLTLAAYDPGCDVQDRMPNAGLDLIELLGTVAEEG